MLLIIDRHLTSAYANPISEQIRICVLRGFLRLRNNYVPVVSSIVVNAIIAVVIGTVFYGLDQTNDSMNRRSVLLFFALLQTATTPAFDVSIALKLGSSRVWQHWAKFSILGPSHVGTASHCRKA